MSIPAYPPVMSKTRIESFSDGVFSIVLTLLIFNFKVPVLSGPDFSAELHDKLVALYPYFATYAFSFVLISLFWVAHHTLFHSLTQVNAALLWLNNLFLLFMAFIPFPAQVLGAYPDNEAAVIFFGMTMIFASLSFSLMRYYAYFRGRLIMEGVSRDMMVASLIRGISGVVLYAVGMAVSAYSPDVTLSMYALVPFLLFMPMQGKKRKV
jgi:uncharacterized membrane protein